MRRHDSNFTRRSALVILALAALHSTHAFGIEFKDFFPSDYPAIEAKGPISGVPVDEDSDLHQDLQKLGHELKNSVGYFAKRRTSTCLGSPCKIQVFPLAYTSRLSGFWAGVRTSILDVTSADPYRAKLSGMFIRSDSREWLSFVALDIPRVPLIFTNARIKVRTDYSFSTEFQYYGTGDDWKSSLAEEKARYSLNQKDIYGTVIFPLSSPTNEVQFGLMTAFSFEDFKTDPFRGRTDTLLFGDRPTDYKGGQLQSYSVGLIVDSRDNETIPRLGQMFEISYQRGRDNGGRYYDRATLVDRRYYSSRRWTLAHRLTLDGIFGNAPFWRLRSVAGSDPVLDINGSGVLIGARKGDYHDRFKAMESLEPRYRMKAFRFVGQLGEASIIPVGATVAEFGPNFAWSLYTGASVWWNRSLQVELFYARVLERNSLNLLFEHEF